MGKNEYESEVRMSKRQPCLGREPVRNVRNFKQSVKQARLLCTKFHELIHLHHPLVRIRSHCGRECAALSNRTQAFRENIGATKTFRNEKSNQSFPARRQPLQTTRRILPHQPMYHLKKRKTCFDRIQ